MMGDIVNIKDTTDVQLLEHFKRLEEIIPECMTGVPVNPFIQHIRDNGEVSVSLVEFLNQSEFLELLTPGLLLISQELYDKKADTEWYKIMLSIIEEKEDTESFCEIIPLCVDNNIDCDVVRDMVEKSNTATDMTNALSAYLKECSKEEINEPSEDYSSEYYVKLCKQQDSFISQLLTQIEELKHKEKELSNGLEEVAFHSEFANANEKDRCKELELQCEELAKQCEELKKSYEECDAEKKAIVKKHDKESKDLSEQAERLENTIESLKMDMAAIERQLQDALKNRQNTYNRFIEQKRSVLKYQFQAEQLQKQITDIAETTERCKELENAVQALNEEKSKLEAKISEDLAVVEKLQVSNNEQSEFIQQLNNTIGQKDGVITRLEAQIRDLEERVRKPVGGYETAAISIPDEPRSAMFENEVNGEQNIEEEKEFPASKMISFESGPQSVRRKSNWFTKLFTQHSKKAFLKNSRQDQETTIFIKMMEMHYTPDKMQKVKNSLSENVPCFDLYKLICEDPSVEELDAFFDRYTQEDALLA